MEKIINIFLLFLSLDLFSQIPQYNFNNPHGSTNVYKNNQALIGERNNDYLNRVEQENRKVMRMFGHTPPPTQEEIKQRQLTELNNFRRKQYIQEVYDDIKKADNSIQTFPRKNPFLADKNFRLADTSSMEYKRDVSIFFDAYKYYVEMLEDKKPLDLESAVFLNENSYLSNKLHFKNYKNDINKYAGFCKAIIEKEGLDFNDEDVRHYAIQKLFTDTLKIFNPATNKIETHYPFLYDFNDPIGDKDFRNYFVVKLLYKKTGQCHSMPLLYLILAQRLKVNAFISKSPSHSFIQYYDKNKVLHNFETTNGHLASRDWYVSSNHINANSIKNKIYLHPITLKETIAECLVELGNYYRYRFGNDGFPLQCALTALKYFPNCSEAAVTII